MTQGRADRSGPADHKIEPISTAINPAAAANLGIAKGDHADGRDLHTTITPMDAGRGYRAPGIGTTTHHSGSQGKHK